MGLYLIHAVAVYKALVNIYLIERIYPLVPLIDHRIKAELLSHVPAQFPGVVIILAQVTAAVAVKGMGRHQKNPAGPCHTKNFTSHLSRVHLYPRITFNLASISLLWWSVHDIGLRSK